MVMDRVRVRLGLGLGLGSWLGLTKDESRSFFYTIVVHLKKNVCSYVIG